MEADLKWQNKIVFLILQKKKKWKDLQLKFKNKFFYPNVSYLNPEAEYMGNNSLKLKQALQTSF